MQKSCVKLLFLLIIGGLLIISCKKKEDTIPPVVPPDNKALVLDSISINGINFSKDFPRNIDFKKISIEAFFSTAVDTQNLTSHFTMTPGVPVKCVSSEGNKKVTISNISPISDYTLHTFSISATLLSTGGKAFNGFTNSFFSSLDSTPKFPVVTDDALLTIIQKQTFKFFYDGAEPVSGLARERSTSGNLVTIGGSGFGVMALIVGMHRNFITRDEGLTRLSKILSFLETCDRFHGVWPHWLDGTTGKIISFSTLDDGADLVETSYMVQGLITMRQYLDSLNVNEKILVDRIDALTNAVEYDWFTRGQNVLYWHWSPNNGWGMNMQIRGYNETLITYIVAGTSTTHPINAAVYTQGYAKNGGIQNGSTYMGYVLPLGEPYGGPLFFTHYSFLGLDPRNLSDQFANYWEQNVNQSLINYTYCVTNRTNYIGYSTHSWGLTASDDPHGYDAHSPTNDDGVISPTAAVSSIPYTPEQSLNAIRHFYYILGNRLWGPYGFYDAFDVMEGWWATSTLAIDQGPEICMIENYRSALLWNLFMSDPKVKQGLTKLGFNY